MLTLAASRRSTVGQTLTQVHAEIVLPTTARFALCGAVRPLLTEAVFVGERVREVVMGCSKRVRSDQNAAAVFSGKAADGSPVEGAHQHAHFLCEANGTDGRITHITIHAEAGFEREDELAFSRLAHDGIHRRDGHDWQLVLLGVGTPADFGGGDTRAGQSPLLAESKCWISRTPFVPTRHLKLKKSELHDPETRQRATVRELVRLVQFELRHRERFQALADSVLIEPLLDPETCGTNFGPGHFTTWLKFRRERNQGHGSKAGSQAYGFRLEFPELVHGPIALGYGCHFGLGQFAAL